MASAASHTSAVTIVKQNGQSEQQKRSASDAHHQKGWLITVAGES